MPKTDAIRFNETLISLTLLVFLPLILMLLLVLYSSGGAFAYTLDDPYIHLALAKNIWLGNYGINLTEPSAPSSSILWPFILAPFSITADFFEFLPLIINACCLGALAFVIDRIFSDLKFSDRLVLTAAILLSLNAYGLVFTGLEHSLQILLVAVILLPILAKTGSVRRQYSTPRYALAALILLPLVRYEGLAISLPMLFYIYAKGERQKAIFAFFLLATLMMGFSVFLAAHDLGFLPSSVLAKSSHGDLGSAAENLLRNIEKYGFILLPVTLLAVNFWHKDRPFSFAIIIATGLHFLLGKQGWFGRYENYYLMFIVLIGLRVSINLGFRAIPAILCLPFVFYSLAICTKNTPLAASNVQYQQAQMAKIAKTLAEPVAVNDLGLVSFKSGQYVLDLWGLGSIDALRYQKTSTNADWMSELMEKKRVNYAFVYESSFKQKPDNWILVGELKLLQKRAMIAHDTVAFYATDESHAEKLSKILKEFSQRESGSTEFSVRIM
ncbi:MAG: hypothetical protein ABSB19_14555 [Methylomonas sp.]|jgi:hypothetical protein